MNLKEYIEGYEIETDEGMTWVRPIDQMIKEALTLNPDSDSWQACPKCKRKAPLFHGNPDGEHQCSICLIEQYYQIEGSANVNQRRGITSEN